MDPPKSGKPGSWARFRNWLSHVHFHLVTIEASPHAIAVGVAIGIFFGFTPLWSLKTLLSIAVAWLQESKGWEARPKPVVHVPPPVDPSSPAQYMEKVKVMYDLAKLAFETDSTRAVTLMLNSVGTPVITDTGATLTDSYHNLSHHGKAEEKLSQLKIIDEGHMKLLAGLFHDLKSVREGEETLLDRTMILYGSNLGDANSHSTTNMPTLFAGGGFRHGQHLALDPAGAYPLPNLFVSMLQRLGFDDEKFASSTGTMKGLEAKAGA